MDSGCDPPPLLPQFHASPAFDATHCNVHHCGSFPALFRPTSLALPCPLLVDVFAFAAFSGGVQLSFSLCTSGTEPPFNTTNWRSRCSRLSLPAHGSPGRSFSLSRSSWWRFAAMIDGSSVAQVSARLASSGASCGGPIAVPVLCLWCFLTLCHQPTGRCPVFLPRLFRGGPRLVILQNAIRPLGHGVVAP